MAKYPLKDVMVVSLSIMSKLGQLIGEMPLRKQDSFFRSILTAIIKLCECFPPLCIDAIKLILNICQSHLTTADFDVLNCLLAYCIKKHTSDQDFTESSALSKPISMAEGIHCLFKLIVKTVIIPLSSKSWICIYCLQLYCIVCHCISFQFVFKVYYARCDLNLELQAIIIQSLYASCLIYTSLK